MGNTNIRVATVEDARYIQEIYAPYVLNTAITFEEVVPSVEEFQERIAKTLEAFPYLVLEEVMHMLGDFLKEQHLTGQQRLVFISA